MRQTRFDWSSFWDLVSPDAAAAALTEFYGAAAARAAARCAAAAQSDNREADHRFWQAVSAALDGDAQAQVNSETFTNSARPV